MQSANVFEVFLPEGTLEWFDLVQSAKDENDIKLILEEKNILPISEKDLNGRKIIAKGFTDITITDFPIRGRRALLTFRRRYWQIEGQKEYLKRNIQLSFPGTQLEKEFALFLKEDGGRGTLLANFYRKVSADPSQRI
ncbi:MAG: hypothetical protein NT091_02935 [Candidatus Falkowbacteria bacterium]|nr:hypothetical protein [Candidatus Falkowbacteria bacterium]